MQRPGGEGFNTGLIPFVSSLVSGRVKLDVAAATITTMAVGGPLPAVVTVEDVGELERVLALLYSEGQRVCALGFGSNLVVGDAGLSAWVVRLGAGLRSVRELGAGVFELGGAGSLMSVSRKLSDEGFSGMEFAAGIPASIGGAVCMNAGAHGAEFGSCIEYVRGVLPNGAQYECKGQELPWNYRSSGLPQGVVVTSAVVRLTAGDRVSIAKRCADNLAHRRATQPLSLPSSGSVFKNPSSEQTAGMLLEQAGLKGVSVGGALVSPLHANWIVNPDKKATASDVEALIEVCISRVQQHSGVTLCPEVRVWR